jgi:hypothetical protein
MSVSTTLAGAILLIGLLMAADAFSTAWLLVRIVVLVVFSNR